LTPAQAPHCALDDAELAEDTAKIALLSLMAAPILDL